MHDSFGEHAKLNQSSKSEVSDRFEMLADNDTFIGKPCCAIGAVVLVKLR